MEFIANLPKMEFNPSRMNVPWQSITVHSKSSAFSRVIPFSWTFLCYQFVELAAVFSFCKKLRANYLQIQFLQCWPRGEFLSPCVLTSGGTTKIPSLDDWNWCGGTNIGSSAPWRPFQHGTKTFVKKRCSPFRFISEIMWKFGRIFLFVRSKFRKEIP